MSDGDNNVRYFDWVEYPHARVFHSIFLSVAVDIHMKPFFSDIVSHRVCGIMIKSDYLVPVTVDTALKLNNKASRNALIFLNLDTDDFPSVPLTYAPRYCIAYIRQHADQLLHRFEQWHDLNQDPTGTKDP